MRAAYGLTIDRREAAALEGILSSCETTALESVVCAAPSASGVGVASAPEGADDALALYDDDGNGSITCAEARGHGVVPVLRSRAAYQFMRDADTAIAAAVSLARIDGDLWSSSSLRRPYGLQYRDSLRVIFHRCVQFFDSVRCSAQGPFDSRYAFPVG